MNVSTPPVNAIADAYGITRQRVHQLRQRHGLTATDLLNPDVVFEKLLTGGRASKLRKRLLNPANRQAIAEEINLAAIRGSVPPVENKISSIA
jgi:hypothetical protein